MFRILRVLRSPLLASLLWVTIFAVAIAQDTQSPNKRGRKYKAPPPTARFEVTVLRATTGRPVGNASVIFHPLENGRDSGNMELKTNDEGKAVIDLLEIGSDVRLQIIAPGFQTYGEDYKIDKENIAIEVKLKRPSGQYSIYKKGEGKSTPDEKAPGKPDENPKDGSGSASETPKDAPKPPDSAPHR